MMNLQIMLLSPLLHTACHQFQIICTGMPLVYQDLLFTCVEGKMPLNNLNHIAGVWAIEMQPLQSGDFIAT